MSKGNIDLSSILNGAKAGDSKAVSDIFSGFLGKDEAISGCGYLGTLGFIFPEHSFGV